MKTIILFIATFISLTNGYAQAKDTLTNETIIQLTQMGLQSDVVILKIKSSFTKFDVSTNKLINLTNNKVPSEVIREMIKSASDHHDLNQVAVISKNPELPHPTGIYYYNPLDSIKNLIKIDPAPSSYTAGGGGYGGWGGGSRAAEISGEESSLKIASHTPIFYFYFNDNNKNTYNWISASTPKEFALVEFDVKRGHRSFKIGSNSSGGFSSNSRDGIPDKFQKPFEYVLINEGVYKITFNKPIKKGEYCFVLQNDVSKVYDFEVLK